MLAPMSDQAVSPQYAIIEFYLMVANCLLSIWLNDSCRFSLNFQEFSVSVYL